MLFRSLAVAVGFFALRFSEFMPFVYFGTMVCGNEAGAHKPAPEPYLMAARLLGASSPLVVEDSAAGIASGRAAGFEVLAIQSPAEVPELVRRRVAGAG